MTNLNFDDDFKILSKAVYGNNKNKTINGWKYLDCKSDDNGYYAEAFKKGNQIVIVSRGTDPKSLEDWGNNYDMNRKKIPEQINSAKEFYSEIKRNYGKDNYINFTGHSLGGSISQILGSETGENTVTFSAYGVGDIPNKKKKYTDNITNYGEAKDGIFMKNINNQIGTTKVLGTDFHSEDKVTKLPDFINKDNLDLSKHKLENYGNLSTGVEYEKAPNSTIFNKNNSTTPLFKLRAEENVYLPDEIKATGNSDTKSNTFENINNNLRNEFKIKTSDHLKKDMPYIDNINSINKPEQNKSTLFPNQTNNKSPFPPTPSTFNDLVKKSSALNNNVSIDNKDLIYKNSTFGGIEDDFLNKIRGKRFQDLTDEERLKALWFYTKR